MGWKLTVKIKNIRKEKKITIENIAERLKLSATGYKNIESGKTGLAVERVKQIAAILETPEAEIFHNDDETVVLHNSNSFNHQKGGTGVHIGSKHTSDEEKVLYERLLSEKDEVIKRMELEIVFLRSLLQKWGFTSLSQIPNTFYSRSWVARQK